MPLETEVKPLARAGLLKRTIGDELVVYDSLSHEAHCLNRTAALVFEASDGRRTLAGIAAELAERLEADVPESVVRAALDQLAAVNLLEPATGVLEPASATTTAAAAEPMARRASAKTTATASAATGARPELATATAAGEPSRRQALRQVGATLAALAPVVLSLAVPTPAEALNTCIPATACTTSNFGQPCYSLAQTECLTKQCTGTAGDCQ